MLLALCFTVAMPLNAETVLPSEVPPTPLSEWQVLEGDALVVDTKDNMGYLVHRDGGFASFAVVTGQRRVVRYIGRTYYAKTPAKKWTVQSLEVKGDRRTFGPRGQFLRFFLSGEKTAYGIHAHRQGEEMLQSDDRYRSMGCVIVSEGVMDILTELFRLNDEHIDIVTAYGLGEESVTFELLRKFVANAEQGIIF